MGLWSKCSHDFEELGARNFTRGWVERPRTEICLKCKKCSKLKTREIAGFWADTINVSLNSTRVEIGPNGITLILDK